MSLTEEWKHRIERWEKILWECCYREIGKITLVGFTTHDHLTPIEASAHSFTPIAPGERWGRKWEYGWFRGRVELPRQASGQRIVIRLLPGGESLVWVNNQIAGSVSWAHREITLSEHATAGDTYELLLEAYAGHGPVSTGKGPQRYPNVPIHEMDEPQAVVGDSTFGIWLEEVYQLAIDFTTLYELHNGLDPLLLRTAEIDRGLMDATLIVDPELPDGELIVSARHARERLLPLLEAVNGSTMPRLFAFGHAHIDVAWLWPLAETERKIARTIANQMALFSEYPQYRFLQSQPQLYIMLKDHYPELYDRLKEAVAQGKVIPDGSMWVEADTNISSGESLIRQIIHGRRFYQDEFQADSHILWLPDVFGYSGALPQILRGCGCLGFATQKITWAYNGGEPFPYNTFLWEGIDGTQIPAHIFTDYNSQTNPASIFERWNTRLQKNDISSMILSFGWGDGGGGPTRDHIEFLKRAANLEGLPCVQIASPSDFFQDLAEQGLPKERYVGELYFQAHRGTYTSQAKTKLGNRRSEFALREAEMWGCAARILASFDFSTETLTQAWRQLLLNQFHDILPGSSIHRVYEETESSFRNIISNAEATAHRATSTLIEQSDEITIFNSLSWDRDVLIETPSSAYHVTVPSCGWKTVYPKTSHSEIKPVYVTANSLENEFLSAHFNQYGELVSLIDKVDQRELMSSPGNKFCLYKDVPSMWDAWDIDSNAELQAIPLDEPVTLEVITFSPVIGRIKMSRKLHHSIMVQTISLRQGSHRIEFSTTVDWQEKHKLLKVAFPFSIHTNEAIHEIQFGHLRRPNHRSRQYDADRFEVCNQKWSALAEENRGVAILNDSKYGLSVTGNSINLSLLKSAIAPDPAADLGVQSFTYAVYAWRGSFAESNIIREAYELNCPPLLINGSVQERSLFTIDATNIILETVKPAEDGSTDVILRLYESKRSTTRCNLFTSLPFAQAFEVDMMEQNPGPLPFQAGCLQLDFRPFEIKTIRMKQ